MLDDSAIIARGRVYQCTERLAQRMQHLQRPAGVGTMTGGEGELLAAIRR